MSLGSCAGLHSLVRDVVAASRDLGAATVEGAQMQGLMMKAWMAFLGPGREVHILSFPYPHYIEIVSP